MERTLIQYKGGGYDGCFWEWNFAYFDEGGEFHDVHSSGRYGRPEREQIDDLLAGDESYYTYDLASDEGVAELNREVNASLVVAVARWLEQNTDEVIEVQCDECKAWVDVLDIITVDPESQGGIVIMDTGKVCGECHTTCYECGEYTPGDKLNAVEGHEDDGYFCEWCLPEKAKEFSAKCEECGESELELEEKLNHLGFCEACNAEVVADAGTDRLQWFTRYFNNRPVRVLVALA